MLCHADSCLRAADFGDHFSTFLPILVQAGEISFMPFFFLAIASMLATQTAYSVRGSDLCGSDCPLRHRRGSDFSRKPLLKPLTPCAALICAALICAALICAALICAALICAALIVRSVTAAALISLANRYSNRLLRARL